MIKREVTHHVHHPKKRGASVVLQMPPWSLTERLEEAIKQKVLTAEFLRKELQDFAQKGGLLHRGAWSRSASALRAL